MKLTAGADILALCLWAMIQFLVDRQRSLHRRSQKAGTGTKMPQLLQVALGVISAVLWMIENPKRGLIYPMIYRTTLYWILLTLFRQFISKASDWTPVKKPRSLF